MRHTITVTVEVEADTNDRAQIVDSVLGCLTDIQDQRFRSCEVLPGGIEDGHKECCLSVVWAEADGMKTTAGWAA